MARSEKRVGKQTAGLGRGEREVPAVLNTEPPQIPMEDGLNQLVTVDKNQAFRTSLERQKKNSFQRDRQRDLQSLNADLGLWMRYHCMELRLCRFACISPDVDLGSKSRRKMQV